MSEDLPPLPARAEEGVEGTRGRWTAGARLLLGGGGLGVAAGGALLVLRSSNGSGGLPAIALMAVAAVAGVAALAGLLLFVFRPAFNRRAELRTPAASLRTCLALLAVVAVLNILLSLPLALTAFGRRADGMPAGSPLGPVELAYAAVSTEVVFLAALWLRLVRPGYFSWTALGVSPLRGRLPRLLGAALLGSIALRLVAVAVALPLEGVGIHQDQYKTFVGIQGAPLAQFLPIFLAGSVLAPLAEELFFRGYVFLTFLRSRGPLVAYPLSAGLFAVAHLNLAASLPLFAMGLVLAYLVHRTGSLLPSMLAHGLNNALALSLLYTAVALPNGV